MSPAVISQINSIIGKFPDNPLLQFNLGLGDEVLISPYQSLAEVPWLFPDNTYWVFMGIIRGLCNKALEDIEVLSSSEDREVREQIVLLSNFLDDYLILRLLIENDSTHTLKSSRKEDYFLTIKGLETRINVTLLELCQFASRHTKDLLAIERLLCL